MAGRTITALGVADIRLLMSQMSNVKIRSLCRFMKCEILWKNNYRT
jgi:hypothetical protein